MKKFLRFFAAGDITISNDALSAAAIKVTVLTRADGAKSVPSAAAKISVAANANTIVAGLTIGQSILIERTDVTAPLIKDCVQVKTKEADSA